MHVLFQVKVPLDLAQGLREKLEQIQAEHTTEAARFQKKVKISTEPEKLAAESTALANRARRLTIHGLLREVLRIGYEGVAKLDNKTLTDRMAKDEIVKGRPVLTAVSGGKRGG